MHFPVSTSKEVILKQKIIEWKDSLDINILHVWKTVSWDELQFFFLLMTNLIQITTLTLEPGDAQ